MTSRKSSVDTSNTSSSHETANSSTATKPRTPAVLLVRPPPANATIPSPPETYVGVGAGEYSGFTPRIQQLAVMGDAVEDLKRFEDYVATLGRTAPSQSNVVQTFEAAHQWSVLRNRTETWAAYVQEQEGLAWKTVRMFLDRIQPTFEVAVRGDPELATRYPSLAKLFGALRGVARKGVSTRRANAKLEAEGKLPSKGKVGKRRKRAAEVAALQQLSKQPPAKESPGAVGGSGGGAAEATPPTGGVASGTGGAAHA